MVKATVEREFLSYREAEIYTGLHRVTLWRAMKENRLKASGYGRAVRFSRTALDEFMGGDKQDQ